MDTSSCKVFIVTMIFDSWEKKVWFSGPENKEAELQFELARKDLEKVGDSCKSWEEFFPRAISHFAKYGFTWIKK